MTGTSWSAEVVHLLPGRIRLRIPTLRQCQPLAAQLVARLQAEPGVGEAVANSLTGSLLVSFDPHRLTPQRIRTFVTAECPPRPAPTPAPDAHAALCEARRHTLLTGACLSLVLGKRLLFGASSLSTSWGSYDAAGVLTVAASYPFLRQGLQGLFQGRGLNADLAIGAAGLAATVVRENTLGLAALFLTSLTHLALTRALVECQERIGPPAPRPRQGVHDRRLADQVTRTATRWGRLAVGAALATGLLTGNGRRALAVLIAAAPAAAAVSASLPLAAATATAARTGVLARGPAAVAAAGHADAVLVGAAHSEVEALQAAGRTVAVVGGDDSTLAAADLALTVGAPSPAADGVILDPDVSGAVRRFLGLARRAVRTAHWNRGLATLLNLTGLVLAAIGLLSPLAASLWHNLTSLAVVVNSMRLLPH